MLKRRQLFQFAGVAAVAGGPFCHYPFDPVAAENFQQKLFIPGASGPFGVLEAIPADPPWQFQNLTW